MVTTVTTLWEGVLDLWSGHARLLPCLWWEPKGCCGFVVTAVTAMTLMTLIYGLILDKGRSSTS
jgi:hypothetical protein